MIQQPSCRLKVGLMPDYVLDALYPYGHEPENNIRGLLLYMLPDLSMTFVAIHNLHADARRQHSALPCSNSDSTYLPTRYSY